MAQRGAERAKYAPAPQHADDDDEPDDEWSGLSSMCCQPAPAADRSAEGEAAGYKHVHVGQGNGRYEKVHSYKYVGEGAGRFHREEVVSYQSTSRLRSECVCLLLAAMILLLIVLWPRIYGLWPGGAVEEVAGVVASPLLGALTNSSNATETVEGSLVVDNLSYEDVAGDAALSDALASAVEQAVASQATRAEAASGGGRQAPRRHGGGRHGRRGERPAYAGGGAEAGQPIQPSQVTAVPVRGTNTSVGVDFVITDLLLGRADAVAAGLSRAGPVESSVASHLAADATVQAAATGSVGVHGFALYSHAEKSSSASTSASTTAAAPSLSSSASTTAAAPSFDCDVDYSECYECIRKSWSPAKLTWCCDHRARGCETTTTSVVYDCSDGYDNWRRGWSDIKKQFCCRGEGLGCELGDNASERGGNTTSTINSTDITNASHSNVTHAVPFLIQHVANKTSVTNASAAQQQRK